MNGERHSIAVLTSRSVPLPQGATELFDELGCSVSVYVPETLPNVLGEDMLFVWDTDLHEYMRRHWSTFSRVAWMHAAVTGVDSFLFPELVDSDITLTNAAGIYNVSIAEFVAYSVLAHAKRSGMLWSQQHEKTWKHIHSESVNGSHAVIYGTGSIGRTVGAMLHGLGLRVRGIDPYVTSADRFERIYSSDKMREAVEWADCFIICAPLTEATRHSINREVFSWMKPTCHVINVGRGAVIDEKDLIDALQSHRIGSASLDVFEQEPLPADSPLWDMNNVSISPHISGDAGDFEMALIRQFVDLAKIWLSGGDFPLVVDKEKGYAVRR